MAGKTCKHCGKAFVWKQVQGRWVPSEEDGTKHKCVGKKDPLTEKVVQQFDGEIIEETPF